MLAVERLKEVVSYDSETGDFTWVRNIGRGRAGEKAGYVRPDGYLEIAVCGRRFMAHRLVFLYVHGALPAQGMECDHINGNRLDNRLSNLRVVTKAENNQNMRRAKKSNRSSGVLGVYANGSGDRFPWRSQIVVNRKQIHLGLFKTIEEAQAAYLAAKRVMHPGCTL
jgi:hypothetical protein